jgi:hypothetical protein
MVEFHERLFPLAGYPTRHAYEEASDPMRVAAHATTPTVVLNAMDDPVCAGGNVRRHAATLQLLPRALVALTHYGGHCGFYEAARPVASWSDRAIAEYLSAAHDLAGLDSKAA